MLAAMSIPVFAAETPAPANNKTDEINSTVSTEQGVITITNATAGQTYAIYKIFDAEIVDGKSAADADGVTYSLKPDSEVCALLFGSKTQPKENTYFAYDWDDHRVTLKNKETDGAKLVEYLQGLIKSDLEKGTKIFPCLVKTAAAPQDTTEETTVVFDKVQYGYYLIQSGLGGIATLNSSAPTMTVIDKNQIPGDVDKFVKKGNEEYNTIRNTVNIGDVVTYKIAFSATNYDGQEKVRAYEVFDVKGTGIWAEFNSFQVFIGNVEKPGYYMKGNATAQNTNNWAVLGSNEAWGDKEKTPANAEWFLVHTGFDTYSILIPWVSDYSVQVNATRPTEIDSVTLPADTVLDENIHLKYGSPVNVEITYTAAIEPNASMGSGTANGANLFNEAQATWKTKTKEGSSEADKVYSETYGLTILKTDMTTSDILEGAKFEVYTDEDLKDKLFVIPTGVDGVYMVDSVNSDAEHVSGTYMQTARKYFAVLKTPDGVNIKNSAGQDIENEDLAKLYDTNGTPIQSNEVVTAANGRLVILGLDLGTYHFVETEAPGGYNKLEGSFSVTVTPSTKIYKIYTDAEGNTLAGSSNATYTYSYVLTEKEVGNSKGASLPATGGEGRMMLITIGSMIAMGFAVLLITQKKMSIYKD